MDGYSQNWLILKVTTSDKVKCTKYELETIYTLSDLLDFAEDIDTLDALRASQEESDKAAREAQRIREEAKKR